MDYITKKLIVEPLGSQSSIYAPLKSKAFDL
jgi:hypothetical protein